jgi:thymidylate kinase
MQLACVNLSSHLRDMMHSHLSLAESTLFLDIDENDSRARLRKRDASKDERETNETKESEAKKNETRENERDDSTNDEIAL